MLSRMRVETVGAGPRVVLVHGSVGNGRSTWEAQLALADRFTLVIPDRPGSPPNPPLDVLRAAPFPKLVVSGAHSAAFDAVCDVLEERLRAERAVLSGAQHSVPRAPGFNEVLAEFLARVA